MTGVFDTPVPHDVNAEMAVLGACLTYPTAFERARKVVAADDFYRPGHETLWRAMAIMTAERVALDPVALLDRVRRAGDLTRIGGGAYIHELVAAAPFTESVAEHAEIVRETATRRQVIQEAQRLVQRASNGESEVGTLAADAATSLAKVRDRGTTVEPLYLSELLTESDEYDWLIPNLLERGDRLIFTGLEGQGKSTMMRQFAVCLAAGLHPFTLQQVPNRSIVLFVDAENSRAQTRRKMRGVALAGRNLGEDPTNRIALDIGGRMDVTADRVLSRLHSMADYSEADVLVIGPLYKLSPKAIQSDDDATPLLAALDTFRERGMTLLIEAHAGHAVGKGGRRDLRPRGSSALLGWPEFGIGLREDEQDPSMAHLEHWRGQRDDREWPEHVRRGGLMPWTADPWNLQIIRDSRDA